MLQNAGAASDLIKWPDLLCMQIPGWWEEGIQYWQITVLDNDRKVRICWSGDGDIACIPIHIPINNVVDEAGVYPQ